MARWMAICLGVFCGVAGAARAQQRGTDLYGDPLPPGAVARLGSLRFRFDRLGVDAVAYWPNGRGLLAVNSLSARAFDARSGRRIWRMDSRLPLVNVGITADKDVVLAADSTRAVFLYLHPLLGQASQAYGIFKEGIGFRKVAFSPNGTRFALYGGLRRVDVWAFATGHKMQLWDPGKATNLCTLRDAPHPVGPLAFSADATRIAAGGRKTVMLWNAATGKVLGKLTRPEEITALAVSPDGRHVAVVTGGNYMVLWDPGSTDPPNPLAREGRQPVTLPAFSPDGKLLAYRCGDVVILNAATGRETRRLTLKPVAFQGALAFGPHGKTVTLAADRLHVWDLASGQPLDEGVTADAAVRSAAFAPDGQTVATRDADAVRIWRTASGQLLATLTPAANRTPEAGLALTGPKGVVVLAEANSLAAYHARERVLLKRIVGAEGERFAQPVLSPDGRLLAAVSSVGKPDTPRPERSVRVWRLAGWRELPRIDLGPQQDVAAPAFSPDGKRLAVGCRQLPGRCSLQWFTPADGNLAGLYACDAMPAAAAFSPDGKQLACVYVDGQIELVDPATRRRREVRGALGGAWTSKASMLTAAGVARSAEQFCLAWTPDGKDVLVGDGLSGIVRIRAAGGKVLGALHPERRFGRGEIPPAGIAAFTRGDPGGRLIAWPAPNGTVLLYSGQDLPEPEAPATQPGKEGT